MGILIYFKTKITPYHEAHDNKQENFGQILQICQVLHRRPRTHKLGNNDFLYNQSSIKKEKEKMKKRGYLHKRVRENQKPFE